jgi:hypothetical protein
MRILKCDGARNYHSCAIITLAGDIELQDGNEFIARTRDIAGAGVDLSGAGGNFFASPVIGENIHARGFNTYVPPNSTCASSCANIWIAGRVKDMGLSSTIIWHAPFDPNDPDNADGRANFMEGIYLAGLGFDYRTAERLFGHDPNDAHATLTDEQGNVTRKDFRWNGQEWVAQ